MTVKVDSQPMTDQNMWYIDMCYINTSISCLEKKTTFGTHQQTYYVVFNVGLNNRFKSSTFKKSDTNKYLYIWNTRTDILCHLQCRFE